MWAINHYRVIYALLSKQEPNPFIVTNLLVNMNKLTQGVYFSESVHPTVKSDELSFRVATLHHPLAMEVTRTLHQRCDKTVVTILPCFTHKRGFRFGKKMIEIV